MDGLATEDRDALVQSCARRLARELRLRSVDPRDLVNDGHVALLQVEQRFDPSRGVPFAAFAYSRVRGAMIDGLRRGGRRTPKGWAAERTARMDAVTEEVGREKEENERDRDVDAEAMAGALDAAVGKVMTSYALTSVAEVEQAESPEDARITELDIVRLRREVRALSRNAQRLLAALYVEDKTIEDAGRELRMSRTRASRMHTEVLTQLREKLTLRGEAHDGR